MPYPTRTPTPSQQAVLPMEMPQDCAREVAMRELFATRWSRWHRARSYEEAVADPVTARLLGLAVSHGKRSALDGGRR